MNQRKLSTTLRAAGLVLALGTAGTWLGTGAHPGWTQTSVVEMREDEITGIHYPVRRPQFVAGVELLVAGLGSGMVLAGLSLLRRPRRAAPLSASVSA